MRRPTPRQATRPLRQSLTAVLALPIRRRPAQRLTAAPVVVVSAPTDTAAPAAGTVVPERGNASVEASGGHDAGDSTQAGSTGDEAIVVTVTRVSKGFNDRLTFYLENGQVWRQQTRGYIHYPKDRPFEVEISRGVMGDHRLRVGGEGRLTRVVLVE